MYNQPYYEHKVKRFLVELANGMNGVDVWTGQISSYNHLGFPPSPNNTYNPNEFENYLLNNTKLETASSTRHGLAKFINKMVRSFSILIYKYDLFGSKK
ncbi:MAG: HpaII family restriction endonuclease [Sphingopyxis sp.]|nr:HpaII family restriction endonuclease [Sphingopyxis sp.]